MSEKKWKGCPPRVTRIAVIDDDEDSRKSMIEQIERAFPKLTVRGFDSIFEAYQGITNYDYLLIDVSAVAPQMLGDVGRAWAPIGKYAEHYPATNFIITSAMSRNAVEDVINDCVEFGKVERQRICYGGWQWESSYAGESVKAKLQALISPKDTEWTETKSRLKP